MERPFIFIECKVLHRDEFFIIEGYHPTCAIFYIKQGSFLLKMGGKESVVSAGDCVIFPDDVSFLRNVIESVHFISFKFKVNEKCPFVFPVPYGKINLKNATRFRETVEKYEELMNSDDIRTIYFREHLMEDLLLQIVSEVNGDEIFYNSVPENIELILQKCRDEMVVSAARFICENINEKLSNEKVCKFCGTNVSTLNFKFRRELKTSVNKFIVTERMRKARKLLINTTYSVADIATMCGYDNVYYFSTTFKKQNNLSPMQFRCTYR